MTKKVPTFGRENEIQELHRALDSEKGKAIVVSGPRGMGKSTLVEAFLNEFASKVDSNHPVTICLSFRFTRDLETESFIQMILADLESAIESNTRFLSVTPRGRKQLEALFDLLPKGQALKGLVSTLKNQKVRHPSVELVAFMKELAFVLDENQKAIIFIDADKRLNRSGIDAWRNIVHELPDKVNMIFTQRPDDALITDCDFMALGNVLVLPSDGLRALPDPAVIRFSEWAAEELDLPSDQMLAALRQYQGYPYALNAAFHLLSSGVRFADLPNDPAPTAVAPALWNQAVQSRNGADVAQLLKAYALLDADVDDGTAITVSDMSPASFQAILADPLVDSLVPKRAGKRRIYHSIFQGFVIEQIIPMEKRDFHERAANYFVQIIESRQKNQEMPDPQASSLAFIHAFEAHGVEQGILTFSEKCAEDLFDLGLFEVIHSTALQYIELTEKGSESRAVLFTNLGLVYFAWGDLDQAISYFQEALGVFKSTQNEVEVGRCYGNLGVIFLKLGELDEAERSLSRAMAINQRLGKMKELALNFGNLGILYFKKENFEESLRYHLESLEINRHNNGKKGIASELGDIGNVLLASGDIEGAEKHFRESLDVFSGLGHQRSIASQLGSLGAVMHYKGDLAKAYDYFSEALSVFQRIGSKFDIARVLRSLGILLSSMGKLAEAEKFFIDALGVNQEIGRIEGIIAVFDNLAECKKAQGHLVEAKEYQTKAHEHRIRWGRD